mgnify:CR=1 FL=1|tara:strand:- start:868 stop:1959 length:1092 start_codon:yes stop_codon:yes gene_type:complete
MRISRASDTNIASVDYDNGIGYYTDMTRITNLLEIPPLTTTTYPSLSHIGELIKRAEDYIDEYTRESWRPMIIENEFHDFDFDLFRMHRMNANWRYRDYVGFIRLNHEDIRKVLRLSVWRGNTWQELAGAKGVITITNHSNITNIVLTCGGETFTLLTHPTNAGCFNNTYGIRTTAQEIVYLINEELPMNTQGITGSTGAKSFQGTAGTNISNFFYATLEEDDTITISSLLLGDDGDACTLAISGSGISIVDFTDDENRGRNDDWWTLDTDGSIFFRANYPYQMKHSLRVTYIAGKNRVPAIITDAATKLVCCELFMEDDSSLLMGESSDSGVDIKTKHDTYTLQIHKILDMKKRLVYFIDSD